MSQHDFNWYAKMTYLPTFEIKCVFFAVPARIVNISTDVSVNEGSNVSLMCLAIGRPEPTILWKLLSSKGNVYLYWTHKALLFNLVVMSNGWMLQMTIYYGFKENWIGDAGGTMTHSTFFIVAFLKILHAIYFCFKHYCSGRKLLVTMSQ